MWRPEMGAEMGMGIRVLQRRRIGWLPWPSVPPQTFHHRRGTRPTSFGARIVCCANYRCLAVISIQIAGLAVWSASSQGARPPGRAKASLRRRTQCCCPYGVCCIKCEALAGRRPRTPRGREMIKAPQFPLACLKNVSESTVHNQMSCGLQPPSIPASLACPSHTSEAGIRERPQ